MKRRNICSRPTRQPLANARKDIRKKVKREVPGRKTTNTDSIRKKLGALSGENIKKEEIGEGIIGRENELHTIKEFLNLHIAEKKGSSLYVCGSPGTGKTLSVTKCLASLNGNGSEYVVAQLNGNTFSRSSDIYIALAKTFCRGFCSRQSESARMELEKTLFHKRSMRGAAFVCVVDEIDQLFTSERSVLYQLFAWAHRRDSRFVLVGIANSVNIRGTFLPDLEKQGHVPDVLVYPAYNKSQLVEILQSHTARYDWGNKRVVFDNFALEYCAAKLAATSGDVRKALATCVRAGVTAIANAVAADVTVSQRDVASAISSDTNCRWVETIHALPQQAQYALISIVQCIGDQKPKNSWGSGVVQSKNGEDVTVQGAYKAYRNMTTSWKLPHVSSHDFNESLIFRLKQDNLISQAKGKLLKIRLNPSIDDIVYAFEDEPVMSHLLTGKENSMFGANLYV